MQNYKISVCKEVKTFKNSSSFSTKLQVCVAKKEKEKKRCLLLTSKAYLRAVQIYHKVFKVHLN